LVDFSTNEQDCDQTEFPDEIKPLTVSTKTWRALIIGNPILQTPSKYQIRQVFRSKHHNCICFVSCHCRLGIF
jgi:hypothetical protein